MINGLVIIYTRTIKWSWHWSQPLWIIGHGWIIFEFRRVMEKIREKRRIGWAFFFRWSSAAYGTE